MICADCKWWRFDAYNASLETNWGRCRNFAVIGQEVHRAEGEVLPHKGMKVMGNYFAENFGCIFAEAKDNAN